MERMRIMVVEDAFSVAGRGIIATGIWLDEAQKIPNDALVEVVRPDGITFRTNLCGVAPFTKCFSENRVIGLLFGNLADESQMPLRSEVWWLVESRDNSSNMSAP
jgi:translation elongation factor EF-Tu-like GTPase